MVLLCTCKGVLHEALCLQYNWQSTPLPSHCICSKVLNVHYSLICQTGCLLYNELPDFTAKVCSNTTILNTHYSLHQRFHHAAGARLAVFIQAFWCLTSEWFRRQPSDWYPDYLPPYTFALNLALLGESFLYACMASLSLPNPSTPVPYTKRGYTCKFCLLKEYLAVANFTGEPKLT